MKFKALLLFAFLIPLISTSQTTTIVEWNFPNSPDNAIADAGIAANLAKTISTVTTAALDFSNAGVTTRSAEAPSGWAVGDYWLIDFVSTGYSNLSITSSQASHKDGPRDFNLEYSTTGSGGPWTLVTTTTSGNGVYSTLATFALPAACDNQAQVFLRWIVSSNIQADGGSGISGTRLSRIDNILITCPPAAPANDLCAGAIAITCGSTTTGTTVGTTSTGDPSTTCGTSAGTPGVWYSFVGTGGTTTASLCGSSYDTKIQVFTGGCGTTCVVGNDDFCSLQSQVTWAATTGVTYYIFVGGYSGATGAFTLALTCVLPTAPNCGTNTSPANGAVLSCATSSINWTAPTTGGTPTQYLLYFGTNNPPTNIDNGTNIGNVLTYSPSGLTPSTTYYWQILPQNGAGTASGCSIFSFTTGPASVANDVCGGATPLTSGVTINDDNTCGSDEAPLPAGTCWSAGAVNSLWYSIVVPAAGTLGVLTTAGTLANTQIAVYSGACSSSMTEVACNDNAPGAGCSGAATNNSQLNLTGLAAGTYYIRVDGRNATVGTYSIMASTTGSVGTAVPVPGGDCTSSLALCANPMSVGNPGYYGTGNICDFGSGGNCTSGETNSVWYTLNVTTGGTLNFTITPNDYVVAGCGTETDYDWVLWKTAGSGATNCATILSSSGNNEIACNYSYLGVTGLAAGGNDPTVDAPCFDLAFEPTITTTTGDSYMLVVQNYSSSTSGFTIQFTGTTVLNTSSPSVILWTGATSTSSTLVSNWGGCTTPSCTPAVDAVITSGPTNQPVIAASTTQSAQNVTINSGASLTLGAGATLNVCGNFINNGTLTCGAGSTINFTGTGTQTVSGNLTGTNKFANFTVTKTSGTVSLLNNIEVSGNLTTANATSIINTNGVDITLAGNFSNFSGTTTFNGVTSTSTFTFNGTAVQTYDPTVSAGTNVTLNNVVANNTRATVGGDIVLNDNLLIGSTGTLTLTAGDFLTGAFRTEVLNTAASSVTAGNTNSFVNGNLRRYLTSSGLYEFPVGNTAKGYQRASTNFSTATIGYIDAMFTVWPATPPTHGGSECLTTYNMPAEDNGYWTLTANSGTGTYDMTLYPTNATNTAGNNGWTIIKDPTISSGTWSLDGTCDGSSTAAMVKRNGMTGFSVFGAAQATTPLPIELLSFYGHSEGAKNKLMWTTASEINNDYFTLYHSSDGSNFESFTTLNGSGNSTEIINYEAYDYNPFVGKTYYRLKQTDYNGDYIFSSIISIENKLDEISLTNLHPNPTSEDLNFDFYTPIRGIVKIEIMDNLGRIVLNKFQKVEEGKSTLITQMNELAKGIYTLKVEFSEGDFKSISKVVKQ